MPEPIEVIRNLQTLQVAVTGPGTVRRMFIVSGIAQTFITAGPNQTHVTTTFSGRVGPPLTSAQFVQAIASASLTGFHFQTSAPNPLVAWSLQSVDADFDDESGQTEIRIEISVEARNSAAAAVVLVSFQVTILATA